MRCVVVAIFLMLASAAQAQFPILFADWFDSDTIETYSRGCYPGVTGTGSWAVVGGVLAGDVTGDGQCYAMAEHPTWDIKVVRFRFRNTVGSVNGVNIHNALGNIGLSFSALPGDSLRVELHTGNPLQASSRTFSNLGGVWLDVRLTTAPDAMLHLNGDIVWDKQIPAEMRALPFRDVRLWGAGGSSAEFDSFIVSGDGVTGDEGMSWGRVKSLYR